MNPKDVFKNVDPEKLKHAMESKNPEELRKLVGNELSDDQLDYVAGGFFVSAESDGEADTE